MKNPKNSGRAPSMQWYPADWRKDTAVQMLDFHDRGVWFEIINIMHESAERGVLVINGFPMPEESIARLLGLDNQTFNQTLSKLLSYGVAKRRESDGAIYCKRMVQDEKLSEMRRNAGKLGGNPNLVNQKSTTPVNQNPTPSSSTSSSTSYMEESEILDLDSEPSKRKTKAKFPFSSEVQAMIRELFRRRSDTAWSEKEIAAAKKLKLSDEQAIADLKLMKEAKDEGWAYYRREVLTLFGNWQGQVDKSRDYLDSLSTVCHKTPNNRDLFQ